MTLSPARFLVALGILGAGAGLLIHRTVGTTGTLRERAPATARVSAELAALRGERERLLAAQPSLEELERLQAESVEFDRASAAWKTHRAAIEQQLRGDPGPRTAPRPVAAVETSWRNQGKAVPAATLETVVWAARGGHVAELEKSIAFDDTAAAEAARLFAGLPEDLRQEFGTPTAVVAQVMAAKTRLEVESLHVLNETPSTAEETTVRATLRQPGGRTRETTLRFRHTADGWRLLVPAEVIRGYQALMLGLGPTTPNTAR